MTTKQSEIKAVKLMRELRGRLSREFGELGFHEQKRQMRERLRRRWPELSEREASKRSA